MRLVGEERGLGRAMGRPVILTPREVRTQADKDYGGESQAADRRSTVEEATEAY